MSVDMTTEELKRLAENIMPGPWKIADFWGSGMLEICPDYPHPSGGEWDDIAQVNDLGDTYDDASQYPNTPVLAQAHARAIALVPDLLRELIEQREADAPVTAREAEPVAWRYRARDNRPPCWDYMEGSRPTLPETAYEVQLLYTHPPQPSETVAEALREIRAAVQDGNLSQGVRLDIIDKIALRALSSTGEKG